MSDLQKAWAKSMLAKLPPEPPPIEDGDVAEEADDGLPPPLTSQEDDSSSSASSTGTVRPPASQIQRRTFAGSAFSSSSHIPLEWTDFFAQQLSIRQEVEGFRIVHHAYVQPPINSGPLFVTHHGAGSSGLSFAAFCSEICKALPNAGVLSLDARGHGESTTHPPVLASENQQHDLTLKTLGDDLYFVTQETKRIMNWAAMPDIILVGHSLGGAVVTDIASRGLLGSCVLGYAVLDVVEGSALDALRSMETYLVSRPSGFPSLASGIEWHTRSRTIRNSVSARVSVPSLLKESLDADAEPNRRWLWRTDLNATKKFWESWFVGLSKKFLEAKGGKLLLLAGTDRLDKELMIGQMQGKYQLQVFPDAGHFLHEDQPARTAQVLADFYTRNNRILMLPPKVSDMLKVGKESIA